MLFKFIIVCLFTMFSNYFCFSQSLSYTVVGTGVTKCYGNMGPLPCPTNPTDSFYGQYQGITPSYKDNGDGTISI